MNPNDQTGILSSIVPDSLTITQTGGVDPLLQGIGNIPQLDFNKLYTISENQINKEYATQEWSSKDEVIKYILIQMAHNDGLQAMGNSIEIKKI